MLEMKNEEIKQLRKEKMEKHLEVKICIVYLCSYYDQSCCYFFGSNRTPDDLNGTKNNKYYL